MGLTSFFLKRHIFTMIMLKSIRNAIFGLRYVWATQRNIRVQFVAFVLVILASFLFSISAIEWVFILSACFFVIGAEIFNTSVEKLVDLVESKRTLNCKLIKDIAAGFVLVVCVYAIVIGGVVFIPKIIALL